MGPGELHARVSPSKLQRIIDCPGSFQAAGVLQSDQGEGSAYAREGTLLHKATERYLRQKLTGPCPHDIVQPELEQEQCDAVDDCIDYLNNILRTIEGPYRMHIEKHVELHSYDPCLYECDGTCDIIIITAYSIIVIDWKFGQGVPVYVTDNDQLYAYAAGAMAECQELGVIENIDIHIVQPRLDNYDFITRSPNDLKQWLKARVIPGIKQAYSDDAPFNPGKKQCMWCPVTMCRARINWANQTAADIFGAHEKLPAEVTLEEVAEIVRRAPMYEACIKDLRTFLQRKLENGEEVPYFKMVRGRSLRTWIDFDKAEAYLETQLEYDEMYTHKMISISQAEKLNRKLKKDPEFVALWEKPPGKLTMVDENDKRPPVEMKTAAQKFGEAEDE